MNMQCDELVTILNGLGARHVSHQHSKALVVTFLCSQLLVLSFHVILLLFHSALALKQ